jgi:lipopolysaccharide export system protein LptA
MKCFSLIVMAGLCGWMVHAQTNAVAQSSPASATTNSPAVPPPPRAPAQIYSDSADFDLNGHQAVHRGHVRVDDPEMKLTCSQLVADVPPAGGHPNHIVAETNVVIDFTDTKGQTNHTTSDKAVYVYNVQDSVTNETVTLTGNPVMVNAQGTQTGDVIIWDRANSKIHFDNPHMIFRQSLNSATADTNSAAAQTNSPPTTNSVATDTNFPPGKLDLIPEPRVAPRNF